MLSATLAGLAGATKMLVFKFATLTDAHWHLSGEVVRAAKEFVDEVRGGQFPTEAHAFKPAAAENVQKTA